MVSVQLARTVQEAVLLIIRRSWVRAPPAPPAVLPISILVPGSGSWTDVGSSMCRYVMVRGLAGHIERLSSGSWRVKVYAGTDPLTGREIRFRKTCRPSGRRRSSSASC